MTSVTEHPKQKEVVSKKHPFNRIVIPFIFFSINDVFTTKAKARQMLQSSQMSVADVAYSLGFENPTHFSRIFKQQYGIPPSLINI